MAVLSAQLILGHAQQMARNKARSITLGKNIIVPAIIFVFLVGLLGYSMIFKPRNDRFDESARRVLSK